MYWNDTHILIYLVVAIIGAIGGQIIDYLNKTFSIFIFGLPVGIVGK